MKNLTQIEFFFFSGKKKRVNSGKTGSDDEKDKVEVEVDKDNFAKVVTRPKGKKVQDDEPSFTGRMRAFSWADEPLPDDDEPYFANGEASGSGPKDSGSAPEGQLFNQW